MAHPNDKLGLKGLSFQSLKKVPSLIPLYVCLGVGVSIAILYPLRCLLKAPEVKLVRNKNPEPWNEYQNKQYKFLNPTGFDYANYKSPAPKYDD